MSLPPPLPRRHAPKLRALAALDAGLLSPEGERRLRAHLATCAICREAHAAMQVYGVLAGEARVDDALARRPIDFERMELPLRRAARSQAARARRGRFLRRSAPLVAIAAAGLLAVAAGRQGEGPATGALVAERVSAPAAEETPVGAVARHVPPESAVTPARTAVGHVTAIAGAGPELTREGEAAAPAARFGKGTAWSRPSTRKCTWRFYPARR